jgi:predicted peroxiredoxin
MAEKKKLVILITLGLDDERSSVALSIANGGINSGLDVTIFLTSSAVDWVRKCAADKIHLNPLDPPMKDMIEKVRDAGSTILVCPPCAEVRGYSQDDLLEGVVITGSGAMHELIKQGAATLSF